MPELPQMQALAERLGDRFTGRTLVAADVLGFSGLRTVDPPPDAVVGRALRGVGRRAKYLDLDFDGPRVLVHLSQAGRLDVEEASKSTRPRGSVVRFRFDDSSAILVREHGTERKAAWWVLAADDDGPLQGLGPEPGTPEFAEVLLNGDDGRRIHTVLRDQRTVAGVGRGYADDVLHRAQLSPFASLRSLDADARRALVQAIDEVLDEALTRERGRRGGLSAPKLGEHFTVHGKAGLPCPRCGDDLARVSYESHEIVYCPRCQTGGKVLADRRRSRLVK